MKRIALETLRTFAGKNPNAWHQLIAAGTLEPSLKVLVIEEETEAKILNGLSLPVIPVKNLARPEAEIARLESICQECPWNVNWICEHPGCQPCRQRRTGGLKAQLPDPAARCAANKWH
jgi:hypothetical protein